VDNAILAATTSLVELEQNKREASRRDRSREMAILHRYHVLLRGTLEDRAATNATEASAFAAMQVTEIESRCNATRQHTTTREREARRALMLLLAEKPAAATRAANDRPTRPSRSATRGARRDPHAQPPC
jgi:hypothetical protein